jgi:cyanophycin synthetase
MSMHLASIRTLSGPSVLHDRPLLKATLDIGDLEKSDTSLLPTFVDKLLAMLPELWEHRCSPGYPGGFVERLRRGTWMGHVVEHVSLALSDRAGIPVGYGKTISTDRAGVYEIYLRYENEAGMREVIRIAVDLVDGLLAGRELPLEGRVAVARELVRDTALGPSTAAIVDAAKRRGIPVRRLNDQSLVQFGHGVKQKRIEAATSTYTSNIAVELASDKQLTKDILSKASLPVPEGEIVRDVEAAMGACSRLGFPLVIKPLDGNHGRGVTVGITSEEQVPKAFEEAREHSCRVIVEQMFPGRDYRVLVVAGKLVAASERVPAHVVGDGIRSIQELIEIENHNPQRGDGHEKPLTKLCDLHAAEEVTKQGYTVQSVPREGVVVRVCGTANLSTGGTARDVTDSVHPAVRQICERAALTVGLDICGIDLVTPDIAEPLPTRAGIIEVNAGPGLRMHVYPNEGTPRDVGGAIMDMLYPGGDNGRVPLVSVTGTNGKTTVSRMIAAVLSQTGKTVGLTTTEGIWLGDTKIVSGDTTGPWSARLILSEPQVEAAVLETARGGIVRSGLGYDWSDVSVMTNIQADHIGQDGIQSLNDILRIKSVVAERVTEGGTLVLNADDPLLATLMQHERMQRTPKHVVYFSLTERNPVIVEHLDSGGTAFVANNGLLVECARNRRTAIGAVDDFACTASGTARFQIANLLAAIAACRALHIEAETIARTLEGFGDEAHNPGRVNLYDVNGGYVVVDYGHNIGAFQAICEMTEAWNMRERIGVVALPGDRSEQSRERAAQAAACGFTRLIIREDNEKRGRAPGEVAEHFFRSVKAIHPELDATIIVDEAEAYRAALEQSEPGKVIVLFYDDYDLLSLALRGFRATPVRFHAQGGLRHTSIDQLQALAS